MPVEVICPACFSKMKVNEQHLGRRLVCPRCNHLFQASTAVQAAPVQVVEAQVVEEAPVIAEVVAQVVPPQPARARPSQPTPVVAEVVAEVQEDRPLRPRIKKRREREPERHGRPAWVLPVTIGVGLIIPAVVVISLVLLMKDSTVNWEKYGTALLILVPVYAAILGLSLVVVSTVMGGVTIGSVPIAIGKGFFLLLIVVPLDVFFFPWGYYIAMPIWFVGLMALFGMDAYEALLAWGMCIVVGFVLKFTIVGGLLESAMVKVAVMPEEDESKLAAPWGENDINNLGGKVWWAEPEEGRRIIKLMELKDSKITDADMVKLRRLPINRLDLTNTAITDEGLMQLWRIKTITVVIVNGTKVTEEGAKQFKRKFEGLHGVRPAVVPFEE